MTTLAEHIIVDGAKNRPPMLLRSMYDSWVSRIRLFIKEKNGRMMLDSIDEGPLVYLTIVGEDGQTRLKKYSELTEAQQLEDECDVQATNIILYGLPPDAYALVNHQEAAKDIWNRVKLLMKGTEYHIKNVNAYCTTCLISLHPFKEKHYVKLAKSLYTTNYDQLYAYLTQHEQHDNEQREDPIDCINKVMAFLFVVASRFPSSNNQLRTYSNPRNQAIIQDGRVPVQQVQERQTYSFAGSRNKGIATSSRGNYTVGQVRVTISQNSAFQTEDLDAYDLNCDDISLAKAVLMENLSRCDSDVLSEVPYYNADLNDMINQDVQEMSYSKQTHIVNFPDNEITSDSNIIP
nr:hypothetical protein [Tanacetum cinerariifolium]